MEAAVGIVADVIGIVELVRLDVLVGNAEALDERFGVALVRFGNGGGIGGDREGVRAEHLVRGPGQVGGIGAAGECDDHALQGTEIREELLLLLLKAHRIGDID